MATDKCYQEPICNHFASMASIIFEFTPFFNMEFQMITQRYLIPVLPRSSETDGIWNSMGAISIHKSTNDISVNVPRGYYTKLMI